MPDLKHGMRCRPSFRTVEDIFCFSLQECLAAGHIKYVSAGPRGFMDFVTRSSYFFVISESLLFDNIMFPEE